VRIAVVSVARIPSPAANAVQSAQMAAAFGRAGHQAIVLAVADDDGLPLQVDLAPWYGLEQPLMCLRVPVPGRLLHGYRYAVSASRWLRRLRADLVLTRSPRVAVAAAQVGITAVLELHEAWTVSRPDDAYLMRRYLVHPAGGRVVAISRLLRADLLERFPTAEDRVTVIPSGAMPVPDDVVPWVFGGPTPALRVGYVGHLYPGKGAELLPALARRLPWARFEVAGIDASGEVPVGAVAVGGLAPPVNVRFHGHIPHGSTPAFARGCDVLIAPYQQRVEGVGGARDLSRWMSPLKLMEYLAAGRAVVCADLPVLHEVLEEERTALFAAPGDVEDWARQLTRLRDDRPLRDRLAAAGRELLLGHHTYDHRARRILAMAHDSTRATT
jgi:glycosyltransferase involved in cell wall biosynthesis